MQHQAEDHAERAADEIVPEVAHPIEDEERGQYRQFGEDRRREDGVPL